MFIHFLDFPHKGFRGIFNASIIRNFRSSESVVNHLPLRIKPVWVASLNRHPPCRHWQLSQTVNMATGGASMLAYKGSSNVRKQTQNTVRYLQCMHRFWVSSNSRKGTLSPLSALTCSLPQSQAWSQQTQDILFYAARCKLFAEADFSF